MAEGLIEARLLKEHIKLVNECRMMVLKIIDLCESHARIFGDVESLKQAELHQQFIKDIEYLEKAYLSKDKQLPNEIAETYLDLHKIFSEQVKEIDHAEKQFVNYEKESLGDHKRVGIKAYSEKERKDLLLGGAFIIAVIFLVIIYANYLGY